MIIKRKSSNCLIINKYVLFVISFLFLSVFLDCSLALAQEGLRERLRRWWFEKKPRISGNFKPGDYQFALIHGGRTRKYNVYLPTGYNNNIPNPVVIYLHGGGGSIKAAYKDGMDEASDKFGFILVVPAGTGPIPERLLRWNGGTWDGAVSGSYPLKNNVDDVGFISRMIDEIKMRFNVDENRIYSTGISNGGIMSYRLACELSDKIAAVAVVAPPAVPKSCLPSRPISIMHIHGTADPCTPFYGGKGGAGKVEFQAQPARDMVDFWIEQNACPAGFVTSYEKGKVKCISSGPCRNGTFVEFCTITDGGHTWPSGSQYSPENKIGPVSYDISFEQIWRFFKNNHRK